jgi:Antitoxin VbhA
MAPVVHLPAETLDRATAVGSVLASFRMEGLEPDAETAALLAQYEAGALSLAELGSAIERHVTQMGAGEGAKGAA